MIDKPLPLKRGSNMDPNIKALKRRGCINHHGCTLVLMCCNCHAGIGVSTHSRGPLSMLEPLLGLQYVGFVRAVRVSLFSITITSTRPRPN